MTKHFPPFRHFASARYGRRRGLRFLNGGVLRNLNMYSFQKLCPVCSATWLSDALRVVQYEVWEVGSASTGRAPQQITGSPFKYLNLGAWDCHIVFHQASIMTKVCQVNLRPPLGIQQVYHQPR